MTVNFGRIAVLLGAVSLTALATSAYAADPAVELPVRTDFNWTGFHVGASVGVGAFLLDEDSSIPFGGDGFFGEISAGYDYVLSERFLLGAFVDARYGGEKSTFAITGSGITLEQTYGFDLGLRGGYLLTPQTLGYVLGGYSWQTLEVDSGIESQDIDGDGVVVGAGLETVIGGNWTLKNEYRYAAHSFEDGESVDLPSHTYRIGINYRFGAEAGAESTFAAPVYNWSGFYIGAQAGMAASNDNLSLLGMISLDGIGDEGGWGSLNVGYDHEFGGMWVAGIQAGGRYMSLDGVGGFFPTDQDYGFDLLARIGVKANETTLAYVIGGYTNQHFEAEVAQGITADKNMSGYSIGAGLETAVTSNVALNLEYRFSQFNDFDPIADLGGPAGLIVIEPQFHTFGIGLKYKFN